MEDKSQILSQRKNLIRFTALIALPVVISIILANLVLRNPSPQNTRLLIEAALKTDNDEKVVELLYQTVNKNPLHIDFHYAYIHAWLDSHKFDEDSKDYTKKIIYEEYLQRSQDQNPQIRDIGYYALGLIAGKNNEYDEALSFFDQVSNRSLKYLYNSIGYVYYERKEYDAAEEFFRIEIQNKGNLAGAVSNLCRLLFNQKRYDELDLLARDAYLSQYVYQGYKRLVAFHQGRWGTYIQYLFRHDFKYFNLAGFLGALLATFVWYFFLRNLDIFEPEKHRYLFITFLLGAVISPFCLILYDGAHYWFNFKETGHWLGDLAYCIFGIGFFEELVKVIPLLLILFLTRQINESIDFIIYASLGALGFAFMENIMYFSESRLYVMEGRSMVSALSHMIDTSLIGYGIFLGISKKFGRPLSNFFLFFFLACLLHGMFDYWIICDSLPRATIQFTFYLALFSVILYNRMIVNSLNQSRYFDLKALFKLQEMRTYLGVALISLVLFQYWVLSAKFGPELATQGFFKGSILTVLIIYFLSFNLSRLELKKSVWLSLGEGYERTIEIFREPTTHFQIQALPEEEQSDPLYTKRKMFLLYIPWLVLLMVLISLLIMTIPSSENEEPGIIILLISFTIIIFMGIGVVPPMIRLKNIQKKISRRTSRLFDPNEPDTFLIRIFDMEKELKGQKGEMGIWKMDKEKRAFFFEGETHRFHLPLDAIHAATIYQYFSKRKGFPYRLQAVLKINTLQGVLTLGINVFHMMHKKQNIFDFITLLKEMVSPESEKAEEIKIDDASRLVNAEVINLSPEYAGKILTKKTKYYLNLLIIFEGLFFVFCLFLIMIGLVFLCLSYFKDPELPVPSFIGYPAGFLMFGLGLIFIFKLFSDSKKNKSFGTQYLVKHCNRIMKSRYEGDIFVSPDDPDKILVEIVPRSNWRRMMLETATDVGFLKLDKDKNEILYEGDHIRLRIPSQSILSCDLEKAKWLSTPLNFIVIQVKIPGGFREFSFRRRFSMMLKTRDYGQKELFDQIIENL